MKRRYYYAGAFLVFVLIAAAMGWSCFLTCSFEEKKAAEEYSAMAKEVAELVRTGNLLSLDNAGRMLTDKQLNEKIAFSAGFTRNEGNVHVSFEADDIEEDDGVGSYEGKQPVRIKRILPVNGQWRSGLSKVKGIPAFDSVLRARMRQQGRVIPFSVSKIERKEKVSKDKYHSEPFILDVFDPVMYRMTFDIPAALVLSRTYPVVVASALILLLLAAIIIIFFRSYDHQLQMAYFKESLFSNVTHELKSPLTSLHLIIEEVDETAPMSHEHKGYARKELNRMTLLVEKILSFAKMTKEQVELSKSLADVGALVREAVEVQGGMISRSKAKVHICVDGAVEIYADRPLLTNVIITMLDNSLKYTTGYPDVSINVSDAGAQVSIIISDRGTGIPAAFHKKIFEPFFRVPAKDGHTVKGHGLGLSFVKQVIEMHKGTIRVEDNLPRGVSFIINLPKV